MVETHSFSVKAAEDLGLKNAILLNHVVYWWKTNLTNGRNLKNGNYWTFNGRAAIKEVFPYFSKREIQLAMDKLKIDGYIEIGNFNKLKYDNTLWYTITRKTYEYLRLDVKSKNLMNVTFYLEMINGVTKSDTELQNVIPLTKCDTESHFVIPIPNIEPNSKPNSKPNKERGQASPPSNENFSFFENEKEEKEGNNLNTYYATDSIINDEGGEIDVTTLIEKLEIITTEYYEKQYKASSPKFKSLISNEAKLHDLSRFNAFCREMYGTMISKQKVNPAAILAANFEGGDLLKHIFCGRGKKGVLNSFNAKEIPLLPNNLKEFEEVFNNWYMKRIEKDGAGMSRTSVLAQIAKLETMPIDFLRDSNVIGYANERGNVCVIYEEDKANDKLQSWLKKNSTGSKQNFQSHNKPKPSDYGGGCNQNDINAILDYYDNRDKINAQMIAVRRAYFMGLQQRGVDCDAILRDFRGVEVGTATV